MSSATVGVDGLAATATAGEVVAWWGEVRSEEGGRTAVVSRPPGGERVEWLPAPWNARTRVHEYGGGAWRPVVGSLVFSEFADSRLYRVEAPGAQPEPLTPETQGTVRYADLSPWSAEAAVVCVRDELADAQAAPARSLVRIDLAGGGEQHLFAGPHFLSTPRVSPDGGWLTWLSWEHPALPWDETTLWLARLAGGEVRDPQQVAGGQALFQPGWTPDGRLLVVAERGDWWNLHEVVDVAGDPRLRVVWAVDQECGAPAWTFGTATWAPLGSGQVVVRHTAGATGLAAVDLDGGPVRPVELAMSAMMPALASAGTTVVCCTADVDAPTRVQAVVPQPAGPPRVTELASSGPRPDPRYVSVPQAVQVPAPGGRVVHAFVYPPANPDAAAPAGEAPPYLMTVHGGPTGATAPRYDALRTFWTSRGFGVVDVNYGGSTGYGRAYRELLYGQWGVVDVEDCATVARWLGEQGLADPARVVISGGSAGGWTVLSCLARTDAFAAGTSYFGVSELEAFAATTHDFESRYLDQLIGPYPQRRDLYVERAPLTHADRVQVPVLLLQGSEDKIVPPSQSELFRDALAARGIPHAYVLYDGEGHGFRSREAQVHALSTELAFYGQVLGFDPPGAAPLLLERGS